MDIDSSITSSTRDRHNYNMASSLAAMSSYGYHNSTAMPSSRNDSMAETIAEPIQLPSIAPSNKLKWLVWNKSWSSAIAINEHLFTYVKLHNKFDDLWCINPSTLLGTRFAGMFCFSPFIWDDLAWSSLPEMKSPLNFRFSPKQIASSFYRRLLHLHYHDATMQIGAKQWRYYDFGPKTVPPLICIPGIAGTADVYYKQIMSLSMKVLSGE